MNLKNLTDTELVAKQETIAMAIITEECKERGVDFAYLATLRDQFNSVVMERQRRNHSKEPKV